MPATENDMTTTRHADARLDGRNYSVTELDTPPLTAADLRARGFDGAHSCG